MKKNIFLVVIALFIFSLTSAFAATAIPPRGSYETSTSWFGSQKYTSESDLDQKIKNYKNSTNSKIKSESAEVKKYTRDHFTYLDWAAEGRTNRVMWMIFSVIAIVIVVFVLLGIWIFMNQKRTVTTTTTAVATVANRVETVSDAVVDTRETVNDVLAEVRTGFAEMRTSFIKLPAEVATAVHALDASPFEFEAAGHNVIYQSPAEGVAEGYYLILHVPKDEKGDPATYDRAHDVNRGTARQNCRRTMKKYFEKAFDAPEYALQKGLIDYLIKSGEISFRKIS